MVIMFPSEGTGMTVDDELVALIDGEVRAEIVDMVVGG
jgi:hypothetical protein